MRLERSLSNVGTQKGEVLTDIRDLIASTDSEKILTLKLQSTVGSIPEALEIIHNIHTSAVDLVTESSGNIEAAGLLLAAAGMKKSRRAHYAATFLLSSVPQGDSSKKKVKDPYMSCIIETLVSLGARKGALADIMNNQPFITAIDAKRLKIIDDSGIVKSKYREEKNKAPEAAAVATQPINS